MRIKNIRIMFVLLVFLFGCGYRFAGGGIFPHGIRSICIPILENQTSETGTENIFTNDLIYEFTRDNKVVLTSREEADAVLSGVIRSMSIETIAHKGIHSSIERRVKFALDLEITDTDGKVVWSAKGFSANEAYDVTPDKLATEQNRRDAISALSKRLAERVYNSITVDF